MVLVYVLTVARRLEAVVYCTDLYWMGDTTRVSKSSEGRSKSASGTAAGAAREEQKRDEMRRNEAVLKNFILIDGVVN